VSGRRWQIQLLCTQPLCGCKWNRGWANWEAPFAAEEEAEALALSHVADGRQARLVELPQWRGEVLTGDHEDDD